MVVKRTIHWVGFMDFGAEVEIQRSFSRSLTSDLQSIIKKLRVVKHNQYLNVLIEAIYWMLAGEIAF
jgi:hypothetical protein